MKKIIVAGGRDFQNYKLLASKLDIFLSSCPDAIIVSGMAKGADQLAIRYAKEKGLFLSEWPADWNKHGNSAGFRRNAEMAHFADACVCFWDGKSVGTKHMIETAKAKNIDIRVVKY